MVNPEMFKDAFVFPKKTDIVPTRGVQTYHPPQQSAPEDPQIAKMRAALLKILTYLVGGAAILLIAWRVILKFI